MPKPVKKLTQMQENFLHHLGEDGTGNYREAMTAAGYAPTTKVSDIVAILKEELLELGTAKLAMISIKAVNTLEKTLDDTAPAPGTREKLAAANSILDRVGISKTERITVENEGPTPIFILPAKGGKE